MLRMYRIVKKQALNPTVTLMVIDAPFVARKALPGQFIILRVDEDGERIPLTVADYDHKEVGDFLADFVGPLGRPTETEGLKKVCVVGGGVGCAIALPVAKELAAQGCEVTSIIGFRSKDLVILEDEFKAASKKFYMMTDDVRRSHHYRAADYDEIRLCGDQALWHQDGRQHEPDHDRRNGHVRRLPSDGGRKNEVCLRGRARFRRP